MHNSISERRWSDVPGGGGGGSGGGGGRREAEYASKHTTRCKVVCLLPMFYLLSRDIFNPGQGSAGSCHRKI